MWKCYKGTIDVHESDVASTLFQLLQRLHRMHGQTRAYWLHYVDDSVFSKGAEYNICMSFCHEYIYIYIYTIHMVY